MILVLILMSLLVGCGGDSGSDGHPTPTVASINFLPSNFPLVGLTIVTGQSLTFTAEASDESGAVIAGVTFAWASSNSSVASVTDGVVTGVAPGIVLITASSGAVTSDTITLTVSFAPL